MVTLSLSIYTHFHLIIITRRRNESHSKLLLSLPEKWWRLCANTQREEVQEKHLLSLCWVNSRHSCTTSPYSSSPFPFHHSQAVASQKKTWKHQGERVTALYKLKEFVSGVSDVLAMQHAHSCPFLRCSKWSFFHSFFLFNQTQMPAMQMFSWLTYLCFHTSQHEALSSPTGKIVPILK